MSEGILYVSFSVIINSYNVKFCLNILSTYQHIFLKKDIKNEFSIRYLHNRRIPKNIKSKKKKKKKAWIRKKNQKNQKKTYAKNRVMFSILKPWPFFTMLVATFKQQTNLKNKIRKLSSE